MSKTAASIASRELVATYVTEFGLSAKRILLSFGSAARESEPDGHSGVYNHFRSWTFSVERWTFSSA